MGFDVSTITGYVAANEKTLIGKAVIGGKTAGMLNLQTGVKGAAKLNLLTADPNLQAGACGWNTSGSTSVTDRTLTTGQIKVNTTFCDKDLIGTALQYDVKIAVGSKTLPFEQEFIAQNIAGINKKLEETIWQGNTTGAAGNHLDRFDGFIKIISGSAGVVDASSGSLSLTVAANAKTAIDLTVAAIPNAIMDRDDLVVFTGMDVYRAYVKALQDANLYHYTAELNGGMEMVIPGTTIKLVGVWGLTSQKKIYATYAENMFLGTDMEGDNEKFMFWYSEDNSEYRLKVEFNAGVQVAFPDYIVKFLGA